MVFFMQAHPLHIVSIYLTQLVCAVSLTYNVFTSYHSVPPHTPCTFIAYFLLLSYFVSFVL